MKNKHVFIINGSGGVGKDTFVNFVAELVPTRNISSVDPIKDVAKRLGWTGAKEEADRKFLSDLKALSVNYNDYPMEYMKEQYQQFMVHSPNEKFMFIHIREPKEIKRAVEIFSAKTVLVTNRNVESITSNHSDQGVYDYDYDFVIHNDSTLETLREMAKAFFVVHYTSN